MSREQDIKRWLENKVDEQAKQIEQLQAEVNEAEEGLRLMDITEKQLQTKNKKLKEQLIQAASQHYCKTCGEILDGYKRDETYAENDRLKENLRIYGKHKTGCPYHGISLLCDCGFKKIMEDSKLLKGIDYDR